jgi:hypothetical protein
MRRFTISLLAGLLLALASLGSALGHVHGITPLGCMTHDNANAGANGTNGTPADDDFGGPLLDGGAIPNTTGNASFVPGPNVAGRHSALCQPT